MPHRLPLNTRAWPPLKRAKDPAGGIKFRTHLAAFEAVHLQLVFLLKKTCIQSYIHTVTRCQESSDSDLVVGVTVVAALITAFCVFFGFLQRSAKLRFEVSSTAAAPPASDVNYTSDLHTKSAHAVTIRSVGKGGGLHSLSQPSVANSQMMVVPHCQILIILWI